LFVTPALQQAFVPAAALSPALQQASPAHAVADAIASTATIRSDFFIVFPPLASHGLHRNEQHAYLV
jgi:hypothetical protein